MCWDKDPSCVSSPSIGGVHNEPVVSRELLRKVCEPFFDTMLDALQLALEQQQKQKYEDHMRSMQAMTQGRTTNLAPVPWVDDASTDIDDFGPGAFASLLSGASSEDEKSQIALAMPHEAVAVVPESLPQEAPETTTMVCRHWRSKGFCRMESKCKFQHPEHKRGVAGVKGGTSNAKSGDITGVECLGIRTTLSLTDALDKKEDQLRARVVAGTTKKSMGKPSRWHKEDATAQSKDEAGPSLFSEHDTSFVPCTSNVQFFVAPLYF